MPDIDNAAVEFSAAVERATAAAKADMEKFLSDRINAAIAAQQPQQPPGVQAEADARNRLIGPRRNGFRLQSLGRVQPLVTTNSLVRQVANNSGGSLADGKQTPGQGQRVGWSQDDLRQAAEKFAATFRENIGF